MGFYYNLCFDFAWVQTHFVSIFALLLRKFCIVGMPQFAQNFAEFLGGYILQIYTAFYTYFFYHFPVGFGCFQTHFVSIFALLLRLFCVEKHAKNATRVSKKRYFERPIGNHIVGGQFLPKTTTIYHKIAPTKHKKMHPRLESAFVVCWEFDFVDLHQTSCLNKTQNNRNLPTRLLGEQRAFRR